MKWLKLGAFAAALASVSVPGAAQMGSDSAALVDAVRAEDGSKVNELIQQRGASIVNGRDYNDNTPLSVAVGKHSHDWTAFLLNAGADPNMAGKGGETPLMTAARIGFQDAVEWLLGKGAKVDATNRMGETALIVAVQHRQKNIVRVLLARGADPDRTDNAAGLSAREYAERDGRSQDILRMIEAKKPKTAAAAGR